MMLQRRLLGVCLVLTLFTGASLSAEDLNVKSTLTYGPYGPPRPAKAPLCDVLHSSHTLSGLAHGSDGKVDFSVRFEVVNPAGKSILSLPWRRNNDVFNGSTMTMSFNMGGFNKSPDGKEPGVYSWKFEFEDHMTKKTCHSEIAVEMYAPGGVALCNLRCGHDARGIDSAGAVAGVGESVFVHGHLANLLVKEAKANTVITIKVLNADGTPTDWGESSFTLAGEVPSSNTDPTANFNMTLQLHRAGKYLISVQGKDLNGSTSITETIPLLVTELPDWHLKANPKLAEKKEERGPLKR